MCQIATPNFTKIQAKEFHLGTMSNGRESNGIYSRPPNRYPDRCIKVHIPNCSSSWATLRLSKSFGRNKEEQINIIIISSTVTTLLYKTLLQLLTPIPNEKFSEIFQFILK